MVECFHKDRTSGIFKFHINIYYRYTAGYLSENFREEPVLDRYTHWRYSCHLRTVSVHIITIGVVREVVSYEQLKQI